MTSTLATSFDKLRVRLLPEEVADLMKLEWPWNYATREQRAQLERIVRSGEPGLVAQELGISATAVTSSVGRARVNITSASSFPTRGVLIYILWDRAVRTRLEKGAT